MRKRSIALLVGLAVAAGFWSLRGPVALWVMERGIARTLAVDPIDALPDGLHVLLCGAGGPLPDLQRSGPCVAVIAGRTVVVVDAGTGGARTLQRLGFSRGQVEAVFLTHFHSDHIDGLGEMALLRWTGGAHTAPLPVHGPDGVAEVVEGFNRAYAQDAASRTAHHGAAVAPPSGAGLTANAFALPADGTAPVVWESTGLRVTAFAVDHGPVRPAVGYRFEYGGRSVVVSGDTTKSANLIAQAKGVDLLVHEALSTVLVTRLNEAAAAAASAAQREAERVRAALEARVFFDLDQVELRPEARGILDDKVRVLRDAPSVRLRIEGHADERGSTEYNLALGARRASSVLGYLTGFGLAASRFEVMTFGEERPLATGGHEGAWEQNRRAEFVITAGAP